MNNEFTLVLDVGKSNIKLILLDHAGDQLSIVKKPNIVIEEPPYPHFDVNGIWKWFIDEISRLTSKSLITTIAISTHGAAGALVDINQKKLLLPILDYEFDDYPENGSAYHKIRPQFEYTFSPKFSAGLNLGRQLYYLLSLLSDDQKERATLLLYPNYWAWRLTGKAATEITSVGCHTGLWNFKTNGYSELVTKLGLEGKIPDVVPAWSPLGTITSELAHQTGLNERCVVLPGIHDSNAGLLPYLNQQSNMPTVVSTGTWVIAMNHATPLNAINERKDMLANLDINATPVAAARYMGGREFERICTLTGSDVRDDISDKDIDYILENEIYALPSFVMASGPFPNNESKIIGMPENGKALATVYSALMINELLNNLHSIGDIVIEGRFTENSIMCALVASLRSDQNVFVQNETHGIAAGCFKLVKWNDENKVRPNKKIEPFHRANLTNYASLWKKKLISTDNT